jgi:hypothetical protein
MECNVVAKVEKSRRKISVYCFRLHRFLAGRCGCCVCMKTRPCSDGALCQNFEAMGEELSEMYVCKVTMFKAPPLPHLCACMYVCKYTRAR